MRGGLISCDAVSHSFGRLARRVYVTATGTVEHHSFHSFSCELFLFLQFKFSNSCGLLYGVEVARCCRCSSRVCRVYFGTF